ADHSFSFIMKIAPVSELIKKAAKLEKGSANPLRDKVGKLTKAQLKEIAEKKLPDLKVNSIEAAMKMVEGTARQMGVVIE
ncbi:MAG: 50S ribosomal protein L11, partial [Candidatus Magasanikbacteria bacterium]|nr:50S ribosomal protein L11 [Candidatus Magasanikbacteria bacterium]